MNPCGYPKEVHATYRESRYEDLEVEMCLACQRNRAWVWVAGVERTRERMVGNDVPDSSDCVANCNSGLKQS